MSFEIWNYFWIFQEIFVLLVYFFMNDLLNEFAYLSEVFRFMMVFTMTCLVSIMKKAVVRGRMAGGDNNILCSLIQQGLLSSLC